VVLGETIFERDIKDNQVFFAVSGHYGVDLMLNLACTKLYLWRIQSSLQTLI
jgi:hypothetical protein